METLLTPSAEHLGLKAKTLENHPVNGRRIFPDGEVFVKLPEIKSEKVLVVHSGQPKPDKGLEYLRQTLQILKQREKKIFVFFTYFPYSLQDEKFFPNSINRAENLLKELRSFHKVESIGVIDPHFAGRDWLPEFLTVYSVVGEKMDDYNGVILGTDRGTGRRYDIPSFSKDRVSGEVKLSGSFDVEGEQVLVVDDLVESGDTMVSACEKARGMGAESVEGLAAHGVLGKGVRRVRDCFDSFWFSDSIGGISGELRVEPVIRRFAERF